MQVRIGERILVLIWIEGRGTCLDYGATVIGLDPNGRAARVRYGDGSGGRSAVTINYMESMENSYSLTRVFLDDYGTTTRWSSCTSTSTAGGSAS